jgi:hypothetical protein
MPELLRQVCDVLASLEPSKHGALYGGWGSETPGDTQALEFAKAVVLADAI